MRRLRIALGSALVTTVVLAGVVAGAQPASATYLIDEYPIPTSGSVPTAITLGPGGNLWFVERETATIGRISSAGVIKEFPINLSGSYPEDITTGPDGNLWFTDPGTNSIGRITSAGVIKEFPLKTTSAGPDGITTGPDGRLWFTEQYADQIGAITTAGVVHEYPISTPNSYPQNITTGPDGNLWFTDFGTLQIGRMTTGGTVTEFPISTSSSQPFSLTVGPDGSLWFTDNQDDIVQMNTSGTVLSATPTPTSSSGPFDITAGSDGNIWFTEYFGNNIGKLVLPNLNLLNIFYIPNRTFIPNISKPTGLGETLNLLMLCPGTHGIADSSGMGLFGFGPTGGPTAVPIGQTFSFTFDWAGIYTYKDPFHTTSNGKVEVPIVVQRVTGSSNEANVTWADQDAPGGFAFDVQIKPPGSTDWSSWQSGTGALNGVFGPSSPEWTTAGTYRFRAALTNLSNGTMSEYSSAGSIRL